MYLVKVPRSKYFQIVYFIDDQRKTVSTRTDNKKEAQKFLNAFNPQEVPIKRKTEKKKLHSITITEFKNEYVAYVKGTKSKNYIRSIELSFRQLNSFLGDVKLASIKLKDLDRFISITFARTQNGAHLYSRTLKAAFTKAVDWEYLEENLFKKIKPSKLPKNKPIFISHEELKLIVSKTKEQLLKDIFQFAFNTGMRLGEIVNMKLEWIDLNEKVIRIKCSEDFKPKGKSERMIPMNNLVYNIIARYFSNKSKKQNSFVFTRIKCVRLNEDYISKKFKDSVREVGLNDSIHFHTLRHSFASQLVQKGVSLYVVKELLGHEDLSTTQIYSHIRNENLVQAITLI